MIKAIIFDCFGVLVTSSYEPFKADYLHNDPDLINKFMQVENRSSRGEITLEEAEKEFAELAGISFQKTADLLTDNPRNPILLRYIEQELKAKFKIGMLSNVAEDRISDLFTKEDVELFDDLVLSFQVGLAKPNTEIFMIASERLELQPEECVFIDDNQGYCTAAESIGMKTICYHNFAQMRRELELILSRDLDK